MQRVFVFSILITICLIGVGQWSISRSMYYRIPHNLTTEDHQDTSIEENVGSKVWNDDREIISILVGSNASDVESSMRLISNKKAEDSITEISKDIETGEIFSSTVESQTNETPMMISTSEISETESFPSTIQPQVNETGEMTSINDFTTEISKDIETGEIFSSTVESQTNETPMMILTTEISESVEIESFPSTIQPQANETGEMTSINDSTTEISGGKKTGSFFSTVKYGNIDLSTPDNFTNPSDASSTIYIRRRREVVDKNIQPTLIPLRTVDTHLGKEIVNTTAVANLVVSNEKNTTTTPQVSDDTLEIDSSIENIPLAGIDYTIPMSNVTTSPIEWWINNDIYSFQYVSRGMKNPCIAMNINILLSVEYLRKDGQVVKRNLTVPPPQITLVLENCTNDNEQSISLLWGSKLNMSYSSYKLNRILFNFTKIDDHFTLHNIAARIWMDPVNFPQAAHEVVEEFESGLNLFETSVDNEVYRCSSFIEKKFGNITLRISDVTIIAFNKSNEIALRKEKNCLVKLVRDLYIIYTVLPAIISLGLMLLMMFLIWRFISNMRTKRLRTVSREFEA